MMWRVSSIEVFLLILFTHCLKGGEDAKVDVPNLVSYLKWASKVCGCYAIRLHVLQLLPIRFAQQEFCCISKSRIKAPRHFGSRIGPCMI